MKMEKINLKDIWTNQALNSGIGIVKERVENLPQFNCCIGTILVSKAKLFSIEIPYNFKVAQHYLKRFTGVEIQILPLENNRKELVIVLLENDLTDIFIMFMEDIIKSISKVTEPENAVLIISQRVAFWKRLFGKFSTGLLTREEQRGLYGELVILEILLKETENHIDVIEAWQAPSATNQDFYFGTTAIEVKTSKANHPNLKITNEFQLDATCFAYLFIAFVRLVEFPNGEGTLLNKINDIREMLRLSPELIDEFNLKLSHLGISSDVESEYNKISYSIRNVKYYQVLDDFPKITSSMVNKAISNISYEISPNDCNDFEIEFKHVLKSISV